MQRLVGGWAVTFTCACGIAEQFRAVVPSLTGEAAAAAGWGIDPAEVLTGRDQDGLCPVCNSTTGLRAG